MRLCTVQPSVVYLLRSDIKSVHSLCLPVGSTDSDLVQPKPEQLSSQHILYL